MKARVSLSLLTLAGAIAIATAPSAVAANARATETANAHATGAATATATVQESVSSNWSGYVAASSSSRTHFSSVTGSWVQPIVKSSSGNSYSVFWVGLGGSNGSSKSLEQVGTEANYINGKFEYYAWYELVPAGPVKLQLTITPGDRIYAEVSVSGTSVTVAIADQSTGKWVKQTLHMNNPDTASAEWIAEAPSSCDSSGSCKPLSLADFGSVTFGDATATAGGDTGSIADSNWTAQAVRLKGTVAHAASAEPAFVSYQLSAGGAEPSGLSPDGTSFSVSWSSGSSQTSSSTAPTPVDYGFQSPPSASTPAYPNRR